MLIRLSHDVGGYFYDVFVAKFDFWLAFGLLDRGDLARSGGWLSRAQRLLDEGNYDCVLRGYLHRYSLSQCVRMPDVSLSPAAARWDRRAART